MKRCNLISQVLVFKEKVPKLIHPKVLVCSICSIIFFLFLWNKFLGQKNLNPRILCYILLSPHEVKAGLVIQNTWGRHCDKLIFFGNRPSTQLAMTILRAREGYPLLWNKTKSALVYLYENFTEYDWYLKADHDTFVVVHNLKKFVLPFNPEDPLWFGYKLKDSILKKEYMSGGAGYVLSKGGLVQIGQILANPPENIQNSNCKINQSVGYEDLELGKCILAAGIRTVDTRDMNGRERFLPLPLSILLSKNISRFHWIWSQAWNPLQAGDKCCSSEEFISIHQISPSNMRTLYFLVYHGVQI